MSHVSFLCKMTALLKPEFGLLPKNPTHLLHWYSFYLVWIFSRSLRCKYLTKAWTHWLHSDGLSSPSPDVSWGLNATWRICHSLTFVSLHYEFSADGKDDTCYWSPGHTHYIYMISSTGGIDCTLNVWNLADRHFLVFCKKLNAVQKTYHMHYVGKISIQNQLPED